MSAPVERLRTALADRYRVDRELGAGGMATVYLAHDLRHERDVAIKVLHPDLGAVLGAERFLSEIKTTAKLQHPHILPLLDSGAADGLLYYVMPYVRGETLRDKLTRETQLAIPEALRIAREIADALHTAHNVGVIHRDIKPENILLQDGHALVADFGIALAVQQAGGQRMTQTGLSLGTPQYMSPEQATGEKVVDARSDVYALAAVTYEMLTGAPPFTGASVQAIMARIMTSDPEPPSRVRKTISPAVEAAVLQGLAKLPADRVASAREFAEALERSTVLTSVPTASVGRPPRRLAGGAAALALALAAAATGWFVARRSSQSESDGVAPVTRFTIESRPGQLLNANLSDGIALSPDGSSMAYTTGSNAVSQVWLRRFDESDAQLVPGSENGNEIAFSPDGRTLAIEKLEHIVLQPVAGGTPTLLAASIAPTSSAGLAWVTPDIVVRGEMPKRSLVAFSIKAGTSRALFTQPPGMFAKWPVAIRESELVLFTAHRQVDDSAVIMIGSVIDGKATPVGMNGYMALGVADGSLYVVDRAGNVYRAPFDRESRRVNGPSVRVASGVQVNVSGQGLAFAEVSPRGDLVFREEGTSSELIAGRDFGSLQPVVPDTQGFEHPRFSPDGQRLAFTIVDGASRARAVWILDRRSGERTRIAAPMPNGSTDRAEWSPDGQSLLYRASGAAGRRIYQHWLDRSRPDVPISPERVSVFEAVMHPDRKTILGRVSGPEGTQIIATWSIGDTTITRIDNEHGAFSGIRYSPDGRWLTLNSLAEGVTSLHNFVQSVSAPWAPKQVDVSRAPSIPVWSRDGRILYYFTPAGLEAASLEFRPDPIVTARRIVMPATFALEDFGHARFDVGPGGEFVFVRPIREARLVVVRGFARGGTDTP